MKLRDDIRGALERPETLTLIKSLIKKRGYSGNPDVMNTLVTDVVIKLLENEVYFETKFKHSLATFIGQVLNAVLREAHGRPDALDGDLLHLDTPVTDEGSDEPLTLHDLFSEEDAVADTPTFITQPGVPEKMTYYLSQLTGRQSDVFTLKAVYGHTHTEIAELLGVSEKTARNTYLEAKRELYLLRQAEEAYEAKLEIGNVCGRIISNNDPATDVWNDWAWREENNIPGTVYHPLTNQ